MSSSAPPRKPPVPPARPTLRAKKGGGGSSSSSLLAAAAVVAVAVVAWACWSSSSSRRARDNFASARAVEVAAKSRELFERAKGGGEGAAPPGAAPGFAAFRAAVGDLDAVTYADTLALWRRGALTPEAVDKVL